MHNINLPQSAEEIGAYGKGKPVAKEWAQGYSLLCFQLSHLKCQGRKIALKFCTEGPQSASPWYEKGFLTSRAAAILHFSDRPLGWSKILQLSKAVCRETSHCNLLNSQPGEPLRLPWDESWSWLFHSPALGAGFRAQCVSDLCKPWHTISSCSCCLISWKVERLGRICGIFSEVYWTYGVQAGLSCYINFLQILKCTCIRCLSILQLLFLSYPCDCYSFSFWVDGKRERKS